MKEKVFTVDYALGIGLVALMGLPASLSAEEFGLFTYEVIEDSVVITDYPERGLSRADIPEEIDGKPVIAIGESAFESHRWLTHVTMPSSLIAIEDYAFFGCAKLAKIAIPTGVTSIGGHAFEGCGQLTFIAIPSSVTSIGEHAFQDCGRLTHATIFSGVTSIGDGAFEGCGQLTSIAIPASVTSIGKRAFAWCVSLTNITIPASVTSIDGAFAGCRSLTNITIPANVTSIDGAFAGCRSLTNITIPANVTSIDGAFAWCVSLTNITIPASVTSIDGAFAGCGSLTSITIPASVTSIGDEAFAGSGLRSITIPSSVTSIGEGAFKDCDKLTTVVFLGNAPRIGFAAFHRRVTIFYFVVRSGFSSPTWNGIPAFGLLGTAHPIILWSLTHGHSDVKDLREDPNEDGVSLLMAYALNLDPNIDLRGSMPEPVLDGGHLTMSFHAASPGITYVVETSADLQTWVSKGVTTSELGPDNRRTAVVERDSERRFLRLRVEN